MSRLSRTVLALTIAAGIAAPSIALSQAFPSRTVRIVIGFSPGGLSDTLARGLAGELAKVWGQSVVVENRPGGGDVIATDIVAKSAADGYTILQTNHVTWHTNKFLRKGLPYDPGRDFTPVVGIGQGGGAVLIGRVSLPGNNLQEFVAWARTQKDALNFGSFGIGSPSHLDALALNMMAGIKAQHIPYKGGADALRAVYAGQVDYAFVALPVAAPLAKAGKIRALAYGGKERTPMLPDMPTLIESGYDLETGAWFAWFAPAATPKSVIDRIAADTSRLVATAAFREKFLVPNGMVAMNMEAAALAVVLKEAEDKFAARYKGLDINLD